MVTDPVCKMTIDENKAAGKSDYGGKTYFFGPSGIVVGEKPRSRLTRCPRKRMAGPSDHNPSGQRSEERPCDEDRSMSLRDNGVWHACENANEQSGGDR
jgi:hypothetical protein